jgi:hypothetical protein
LDGTVLDGYWQGNKFIKGRLITVDGVTLTGGFSEDNTITNVNLKAANYTYEGELINGLPFGKGRLDWDFKLFKNKYEGTFEAGTFKQGILTSYMGEKLARSMEGFIDVKFASDPVAPQLERVEETKEAEFGAAKSDSE